MKNSMYFLNLVYLCTCALRVWKVFQKLALLAQDKFGRGFLAKHRRGHQRWGTMGAGDFWG